MKIYYLTSSQIPSINANTINVLSMCYVLAKHSNKLNFFFTSIDGIKKEKIEEVFDISLDQKVKLNFVKTTRFHEILIFLNSLKILLSDLIFDKKPDLIICRNIYGSIFYSFFFSKVAYETHTIERNFLRKYLQKKILNKKSVLSIVITHSLKQKLINNYKLINSRILVLPDASFDNTKQVIKKYKNYQEKFKVGYFGHLYRGRGIDLIINLAKKHLKYQFYIVGGDNKSILKIKKKLLPRNIIFLGHQNFKTAKEIMTNMDVLLCPYQKKVFLKDQKTSTSTIMSPLKIFEYMSSKKPIISSNLNVLREVLRHNVNSFLANPTNVAEWSRLLDKIYKNKNLSNVITNNAYLSFKSKYSWDIRVKNLLINL